MSEILQAANHTRERITYVFGLKWLNSYYPIQRKHTLGLGLRVMFMLESRALDKGRPGRPWTSLASDCTWCRTVNGHKL